MHVSSDNWPVFLLCPCQDWRKGAFPPLACSPYNRHEDSWGHNEECVWYSCMLLNRSQLGQTTDKHKPQTVPLMGASSLEEMGLYQCNFKSARIKEQFGILGNDLICSHSDEKTHSYIFPFDIGLQSVASLLSKGCCCKWCSKIKIKQKQQLSLDFKLCIY